MITTFFIITLLFYFFSIYKDKATTSNSNPSDIVDEYPLLKDPSDIANESPWFDYRIYSGILAIVLFIILIIAFSIVYLGIEISDPKTIIIAKFLLYFGKWF